jgi:hypothetical protein
MRASAIAAMVLCLLGALAACAQRGPVAVERQARPRPAKPDHLARAIQKGVRYLALSQNPDGSWGTGTETRGLEIYSMVPGSHDAFRVATTALSVMALREAGETEAHARGVEYLVTQGQARRDDGTLLYNVWAHLYMLQAMAGEMPYNPDPRIREAAAWHLDRLIRYETYMGGWNYYDFHSRTQRPGGGPTSFGTAAALVAIQAAREAGIDVPQPLIDRALRRLREMRLPDGNFLYSHDLQYIPRLDANQTRGSIGRNQPCNYALWLWDFGKVGQEQALHGLDEFIREHAFIEMGRKRPLPHSSWYQTAPYYFYFDHYYAALLIGRLSPELRGRYAQQMADWIVPLQEMDGSWWDYAMWDYHKPYGTAFAVLTLLHVRPEMPQK